MSNNAKILIINSKGEIIDEYEYPEESLIGGKGESAYELAVRAGFTGTEEEWLESLKGEKGEPGESGMGGEGDGLIPKSLMITKNSSAPSTYAQDSLIDMSKYDVKCVYTDGSSRTITDYTTNLDEIYTAFPGYKILEISYTHNGVTVKGSLGIVVDNNDSYNQTQIAYKLVKAGILSDGLPVIKNTQKIYQFGKMKFRVLATITIEENNSTVPSKIGLGNHDLWGKEFLSGESDGEPADAYVTVPANAVGEFELDSTFTIDFTKPNINVDTPILNLICENSELMQGMFEIKGVSLCYLEAVTKKPISITAVKRQSRGIIGESVIIDDITATIVYNTEERKTVTPVVTPPSTYVKGENTFGVSYTENGKTISTNVKMTLYEPDKASADPFTEMTAREWCDTYCHKAINWGNELDSKPNSKNYIPGDESHVGDNYMNQETAWGQPVATLKNFTDIVEKGFDCIRIPVTWCYNSYTEPALDENELKIRHIGKFWLCRVREVVDMALEAGLNVMINMHHEQPIIFTNGTSIERNQVYKDAEACWTEIAEKFKYYGHRLIFEAFNEVDNIKESFQFAPEAAEEMNQLNQIFVNAVRSTEANNTDRILVCPTLVHMVAPVACDAWVRPADIHEDHIAMAVHTYTGSFYQDLKAIFEPLEKYSYAYNVPVMITEWGTTKSNGSYDFRAIHAQNFTARANYHRLYPMWWDNGSDFELVKKYNRINEYKHAPEDLQKIIDGISTGYDTMKAFTIPDNQIKRWNNVSDFTLLFWGPARGYYNSYWGSASTPVFDVTPGKKFVVNTSKVGTRVQYVVQISRIFFCKRSTNPTTGATEYTQVSAIAPEWHVKQATGVVPETADCCVIVLSSPDKSLNDFQWELLFGVDELTLDFSSYEDSDIQETQLTRRTLNKLVVEKTKTVYALNDTLDINDIVVNAVYNDGYVIELAPSAYTINADAVDMTKDGKYGLVITDKESGVSETVNIYVGTVLTRIEYVGATLGSLVNAPADVSNVAITATYADGLHKYVTDGLTISGEEGINVNAVGEYPLTITYTEGSITETCTVNYKVYETMLVEGVEELDKASLIYNGNFVEAGWTKEQPETMLIESHQQWMYCHFVCDSEFVCYSCPGRGLITGEEYMYVPKTGKQLGYVSDSAKKIATSGGAQKSYTAEADVTDAIGRVWCKYKFNGYNYNDKAFGITKSTLPVYYCTENSLGYFMPTVTW